MNSICVESGPVPVSDPASADAKALKSAMRLAAGGVSVITAGGPGNRTGATVTSATSFSMDPPTMVVAINRGSSTWSAIRAHGHFCVNMLSQEQDDIAGRFAGMGGIKGEMRYEGIAWIKLATGAPVLESALAAVDCVVDEMIERHSHAIILGRVVAVRAGAGKPLVYSAGRYGRFE